MASYEKIRVTAARDKNGTVAVPVPYRDAAGTLLRNRWYGMTTFEHAAENGEIVERGPGNLAALHKAERQGYITISPATEPVVTELVAPVTHSKRAKE